MALALLSFLHQKQIHKANSIFPIWLWHKLSTKWKTTCKSPLLLSAKAGVLNYTFAGQVGQKAVKNRYSSDMKTNSLHGFMYYKGDPRQHLNSWPAGFGPQTVFGEPLAELKNKFPIYWGTGTHQNSYSISHLCGTVTTRWLDGDKVVNVVNCWQHGGYMVDQLCSHCAASSCQRWPHCHYPVICLSRCAV